MLVAGCTAALPPPGAPIADDARRALARLADRWERFSDLRTLADVEVTTGGTRQHVRGVLLAKAPSSVRFEALSPFGQPLLVATILDGYITTYDVASNQATVGPAVAETTGRALGLPFEARELVAVLAGEVAPPADLRAAETVDADETGPSLLLVTPAHRQRIWLDPTSGVVRRREISTKRTTVAVTYLRGADARIRGFDVAAASYVTAAVRYLEPALGQGVEDALFTLTLPKGSKIRAIR